MGSERIYRIGQVWERDGKRREINAIEENGLPRTHVNSTEGLKTYFIWWNRPEKDGASARQTWCSTWLDWVNKATLVKEAT